MSDDTRPPSNPDAFPVHRISSGMSLRDYFAGQALAGLMSEASAQDPGWAAQHAYKCADAMLNERERR